MNCSLNKFAGRIRLILRLFLGAVFIYAAWTKFSEPWIQTAMNVEAYQLLPEWMVVPVARTLPWGELLLGVWLVTGIWLRWAALASTALLGAFLTVLLRSYLKGMHINCGCFGSDDPLSVRTLFRDGFLFAASLALCWLAFRRSSRALESSPEQAAQSVASDH